MKCEVGLGIILWLLGTNTTTLAQVTADGTVGTIVSSNALFRVTGGTQQQTTLFHSFNDFSPATTDVTFQLTSEQSAVDVVIGRVTGNNVSLIDGNLSLTGGNTPDLFFINPNGITFGQNASLNLPGSFIASTAESVLFNDGLEFSAINPSGAPLLSVSTPLGLRMGTRSSPIALENSGHRLIVPDLDPIPIVDTGTPTGLRVNPGETIGLIGQTLNLTGGIISAPGGQTVLGSIETGDAQLVLTAQGWDLGVDTIETFGDITLSNSAWVGGSSELSSLIRIYGHDISLSDNSFVYLSSQGLQPGGGIEIDAANLLRVQNPDEIGNVSGIIYSENLGSGQGANLELTAGQFILTDGGRVGSITFTPAAGGNTNVKVANDLEIRGIGSGTFSGLIAFNTGEGEGGSLSVSSRNLRISDGGLIVASTFGSGNVGEIEINTSESVSVAGFSTTLGISSAITASSFSSLGGNASQLTLNTARLTLEKSGSIGATAFSAGDAGNVIVNASESIQISGAVDSRFSLARSSIESSVLIPDPLLQQTAGLPLISTGDGGNVEITTPKIKITNSGEVAIRNESSGNAGDKLQIQADEIVLNQGGRISAVTQSGNGGNIFLDAATLISLGNQSTVNAETLSLGNGGNITINSPVIVGYNNSDIIANAVTGDGGNINITSQGIFGLEFREELTSENDISVSSQYGTNGTVELNNFGVDSDLGIANLPDNLADDNNQVAQSCSASSNTFIITGRGGIPYTPAPTNFNTMALT